MATTAAAPYGLKPVRLVTSEAYNGQTNQYGIASGYATALHYGTPVRLVSGKVQAVSAANLGTTTTPDRYIGVFMGCSYTDPNTGQKVFKQMYPGSVTASDIVAYVADSPDLVLQIQASTSAVDVIANIGTCFSLSAASGGSSTTGNSNLALVVSGGGNTLPFKIIGLGSDPTNINAGTGLFLDVLVMVSRSFHVLGSNNG